ncbi:DUF1638 domain-containing protein [Desulfospira joergensenii]|uniref:DUF1638 domain-containing protein n=1 Tax=Desulfospira joergensenii TaxID=53329 RepID=UPI0003B3A614|nr:DUF1638 domain-containing protein [Desulfospira joergensenii]
MPRLGIVTCQILELEFAHLLLTDRDVTKIWGIDDEFSRELIRILKHGNLKPVHRITRIQDFQPDPARGLDVLVRVLQVGLHSNIPRLRRAVEDAVREMAPLVDGVFLGYGLCGNALKDLDGLFYDISVPVTLTMDDKEPVDDCVGLVIGGRKKYYEQQCLCAGTMFMNAGFSRHWQDIITMDIPEKLHHKKERILEKIMGSYQRSLLLPTPVMEEDELRENSREFNRTYRLRVESHPGTLELLERAWQTAKSGGQ